MHYICWDIYAVNIYIYICTVYIHRYINYIILYTIISYLYIYIVYIHQFAVGYWPRFLHLRTKKKNTFSPSPYQNVLQNSSSRMLNLLWQPAAFLWLIEISFKPGNHDQGTAAAFKPNTAAQHVVSLEETHSAFDKRTKG